MFDRNSLKELVYLSFDDKELLDMIYDALISFERYHNAIYDMETKKKLYCGAMDSLDYRKMKNELDKLRTACHNAVIANVAMLNRMAEQKGIPPIYDGVVSEDRPYRRELADAILGYVAGIINERP